MAPEQLVTPKLKQFCARHPQFASDASKLAAACDRAITGRLTADRAVLAEHEAELVRVRKSLLDGKATLDGFAAAYGKWKRRDAELYLPIHSALAEFESALEDLSGELIGSDDAATSERPGNSGIPRAADTDSAKSDAVDADWADADTVQEVFDALPARPTTVEYRAALVRSLQAWKPDEKLTEALSPALEEAVAELEALQRRHYAAMDRLEAIMRIIRKHPESVRRSDLRTVERQWNAQIEPFRQVLAGFAAKVRKLVAVSRGGGSRK